MGLKERKERDKDRRRKAILGATRSLLLKQGIDGISMRKISNLAELGLGTIYSYYSSKEDIFADLSEEVFDLIGKKTSAAAIGPADPGDKMRAIARSYLELNKRQASYYDFLDIFVSTPKIIFSPAVKQRVDARGIKLLEPIIGSLEEGMRRKIFLPCDPRKKALIMLGIIHGLMHFRKLQKTLLAPGEFEELFVDAVEGFITSLRKR